MKELPMVDKDYKRSNFLISGKYKSSLLENKIMAISLAKISEGQYQEVNGGNLVVKMTAAEIRRFLNSNSGSIYKRLEDVSHTMTGRTIGWSNPEMQTFDYIAVVVRARYTADCVFEIEFNKYLKEYLTNLKENFTLLNLPTMLSFKNNASFRLYELLRSKSYYPKGKYGDNKFVIEFNISELKLELGIVNSEYETVKHILGGNSNPDYDKAVEQAPEKTYEKWSDFKHYVLDKACKEINERTDLTVKYDSVGRGRGGKIYAVIFTVWKNKKQDEISEDEKLEVVDQTKELLNLKLKDCITLCESANYNFEKIKSAKESMDGYKGEIENVVGFLKNAILNPLDKPKKRAAKKEKTSFNNFDERDYALSELEKYLLSTK